MDTLMQANIFFFISSIAVIVITIGIIMLVIKIRKLFDSVNGLVEKVRHATDLASEETLGIIDDIKQSSIFRLFFPRKSGHKAISRPASDKRDMSPRPPRRRV